MQNNKLICLSFPIFFSINSTMAGGFQLHEQNASLGDVHAGYSVDAKDASTNFYNAAGLTDILDSITTTSAVTAASNVSFKGQSTIKTVPELGQPIVGSGSASTNGFNLIPSLHYATPINDKLAFGLSIVSPFASEIDWSNKDFTRYNSTLNGITTINFSPSFAYKVSNALSVGLGADAQYVSMKINKMVGLNIDMLNGGVPDDVSMNDSIVTNQLTGTNMGWHSGVLYKPANYLKLGFSYRSAINHKATGTSILKGRLAGETTDPSPNKENKSKNLKAIIRIPQTMAFSIQFDPSNDIELVSTIVHTKWDVVKSFDLKNVPTAFVDDNTQKPIFLDLVSTKMNLHNTLGFFTGARWQLNDQIQLKSGFGYDQTPSQDDQRDLKMPDGNRLLFGLGTNYRYTKGVNFELGWMFVKIIETTINKTSVIPQPKADSMNFGEVSEIHGTANGHANLFGLQTTIDTDKILSKFL